MPTITQLINDFLAPVQPEDCRKASHERLAVALAATGPVVSKAEVVSASVKDGEHTVEFERRHFDRIPAVTVTDDLGVERETPERDPTDAELAKVWGLPLACETEEPSGTKEAEKTPENDVKT